MRKVFRYDIAKSDKHGVYACRFFRNGEPEISVVDTLMPCTKSNHLAFAKARHDEKLWPILLEKAYAKFHGAYECLVGGQVSDGLADLTGGFPEQVAVALISYLHP